ncbi:MAG: hypothetical protein PHX62_06815, partial [Bacilli bacterium]|nr:hypothetical protein [Bacilli bacterium]
SSIILGQGSGNMPYLKIENLNIENYLLNFEINNQESIGVFGRNKELVLDFLKIISGINKSNSCFHEDEDIFDNPAYFKGRIFMDYSHTYLSTLRVAIIEENLKSKYNLSFNKEKFIKIGMDLDIRGETEITYQYHFSPAGNTFVNYALTAALEKPNLIIINPLNGLNLKDDINYIVSGITDTKEYNTSIIGIDKLKPFKNKLQHVLFFSDFDYYYLDYTAMFIVLPKEIKIEYPLYLGKDLVIGLATQTKEELKELSKHKVSYQLISIFDLEDYL